MSKVPVLVVDDDVDARTILEWALSAEGYSVTSAVNGADALRAAHQCGPHVILLDLAMPVMDGYAFRRAQLRDPELAGIPVICISGRHDADHASQELGLEDCLRKPFDLDHVVRRVDELVHRSQATDPPQAGKCLS